MGSTATHGMVSTATRYKSIDSEHKRAWGHWQAVALVTENIRNYETVVFNWSRWLSVHFSSSTCVHFAILKCNQVLLCLLLTLLWCFLGCVFRNGSWTRSMENGDVQNITQSEIASSWPASQWQGGFVDMRHSIIFNTTHGWEVRRMTETPCMTAMPDSTSKTVARFAN